MKNKYGRSTRRLCPWASRALCLLAVAGLLATTLALNGAEAAQYDPKKAGNPVRVVAYLAHPIGVLLDYGLMRPCFWIVQHEPFSTIFGYERPWHEDPPEQE
jgi:hypothetical protein